MQRGACEALWLGKPLITSDWPLLREYFYKGTVHVVNDCAGIQHGLLELKENYQRYSAEIQDLQIARKQEWQQKAGALVKLIQNTTL
jgi:glycosyltransferase involved in cell wall biosynthesis